MFRPCAAKPQIPCAGRNPDRRSLWSKSCLLGKSHSSDDTALCTCPASVGAGRHRPGPGNGLAASGTAWSGRLAILASGHTIFLYFMLCRRILVCPQRAGVRQAAFLVSLPLPVRGLAGAVFPVRILEEACFSKLHFLRALLRTVPGGDSESPPPALSQRSECLPARHVFPHATTRPFPSALATAHRHSFPHINPCFPRGEPSARLWPLELLLRAFLMPMLYAHQRHREVWSGHPAAARKRTF